MSDSLPVAFLWHHHQPQYRDLTQRDPRGALRLPWVRLHALRDYYGMAAAVSGYPDLRVTFNFTPVLLEQLQAYSLEAVTDGALELTLAPAERLTGAQRQRLSERFFDADWHHQIYPHRRFTQLLRQRLDGDLGRTSDCRDLQMWFNLAWFAEEFRNDEVELCTGERVSVARFVQQGEGFSTTDIQEMVHEQFKVLRAVIPLHARLQSEGRIEVSTSPYAHPILPLLIDTDAAPIDRPGTAYPARFHRPEDAQGQLALAVEMHTRLFGRAPRGLWPSEGAVSRAVLDMATRLGFRWLATDQGVLARSGRWGYEAFNVSVRARVYRAEQDETEIALLFRDQELSDRIGFSYQQLDPREAASDLLMRLHARVSALGESVSSALVLIVLDGENAWGSYPGDGRAFLKTLYASLATDSLVITTTPSAYLEGDVARGLRPHPVRGLKPVFELATGSWIDEPGSRPGVDLGTWIGEQEETDAWGLLGLVRDDLALLLGADPVAPSDPLKAIYAAEGSDWFWWFGDDQDSGTDEEFDALFLMHLRSAYRLADLPAPSWLPARVATPRRVWTFTRPLTRMPVSDELVIAVQCPGVVQWTLGTFATGELVTTEASIAAGATGRYTVRLGPFRSDAREVSFVFQCRHPGCDGRGPCCEGRTWRVALTATAPAHGDDALDEHG